MKLRRAFGAVCLLMAFTAAAAAQSTDAKADALSGQWGMNGKTFLDLKFDGEKTVSGTVYFRHDSDETKTEVKSGSFDPKTNALKLEGEVTIPGRSTAAKYVIEGTLEKDTLSGTFSVGQDNGQFSFTRIVPGQS